MSRAPLIDVAIDMPPARRWWALAALMTAALLMTIDATVLTLAMPALTADLGATSEQVLWIGDIYSLVIAGLLVLMGNLADRFGRKRVLLIGTVAFGGASLLAAFSTTPEMLIAARVLLGVAASTMMPSTLSLIRNIFADDAERTRAIAIWSTAFGVGSAIGPLVGGVLLEHFWWGSVFLINVPVLVVVVAAGIVLLPESRNPSPGRFDVLSALLSMVTMFPFVYAIKRVVGAGVDPITVGCVLVAIVAGIVFVRRQRVLDDPFLDLSLFRIPAFSGAVAANVIALISLVGLLYFFSQYLQLARGYEPLRAGLAELPVTIASIVVIAIIGAVTARLGKGRAIAAGLLVTAIGFALIAVSAGASHYLWLGLSLIPVGLGVGVAMTLAADVVVSAAPPRKAGAVAAITEAGNELGVVLGIAVLGSLLTFVYRHTIDVPAGLPDAVRARVEDSLASALPVLDPTSALAADLRDAFVTAMQTTSAVAAGLTLVAAFVAWRLIRGPGVDRPVVGDEAQALEPQPAEA